MVGIGVFSALVWLMSSVLWGNLSVMFPSLANSSKTATAMFLEGTIVMARAIGMGHSGREHHVETVKMVFSA